MSNVKWGSDVVPQYSTPTYGKKKTEEEKVQGLSQAVNTASQAVSGTAQGIRGGINKTSSMPVPSNPAASLGIGERGGDRWDSGVDVLGEVNKAQESVAALPQWDSGATFGIRNSLENDFAVDGSRIGYENGNVLLDGKFLMKADNNVNGTTYAKDYDAVAQKVNDYIKNNGLVAIRDYAAGSGTAVNVSWNDAEKTVSINGRTVVPTAVVGGKAYIPKSQLDAILAEESSSAGTSYGNIYNEVQKEYGAEADRAYDNYMNAEEFNYVPENDPAYQAYMKTMQKAINDEYTNNMAAARFRTGGVGSTGQMLQAAAIRKDGVDDIAAARAQFEQNAYERYMDDLNLRRDRFNIANGRMVDEYNLRAGVNASDKQGFYDALSFDRTMQATDSNLDRTKLENNLYNQYAGEYAAMEYGDAVRNYKISEQFAPILAQLEVDAAVLQNVTDRESLRSALIKAGYTTERISQIMNELDVYSMYING